MSLNRRLATWWRRNICNFGERDCIGLTKISAKLRTDVQMTNVFIFNVIFLLHFVLSVVLCLAIFAFIAVWFHFLSFTCSLHCRLTQAMRWLNKWKMIQFYFDFELVSIASTIFLLSHNFSSCCFRLVLSATNGKRVNPTLIKQRQQYLCTTHLRNTRANINRKSLCFLTISWRERLMRCDKRRVIFQWFQFEYKSTQPKCDSRKINTCVRLPSGDSRRREWCVRKSKANWLNDWMTKSTITINLSWMRRVSVECERNEISSIFARTHDAVASTFQLMLLFPGDLWMRFSFLSSYIRCFYAFALVVVQRHRLTLTTSHSKRWERPPNHFHNSFRFR